MKTDETNLPRDPAKVPRRMPIDPAARSAASHPRSASEREWDALDAWRESLDSGRKSADPVRVHGLDLEQSDEATRQVIGTFTADLARLHEALEAAEERLARAEEARRHDPDTGLLRRDEFFSETRHLELLDQREGVRSEVAVLRVDGFEDFRRRVGLAAAYRAERILSRALAGAVDPAEPACRLRDGEFAVLLTGLHGDAALARAEALAHALAAAIDHSVETVELRPGSLSVGRTELQSGESPLDALDRADRDAES